MIAIIHIVVPGNFGARRLRNYCKSGLETFAADSGGADLRPPQSEATAEGFSAEQPLQDEELLVLSGGDTTSPSALPLQQQQQQQQQFEQQQQQIQQQRQLEQQFEQLGEQPAESRESVISTRTSSTTTTPPPTTNTIHRSIWIYTSPPHKGPILINLWCTNCLLVAKHSI
jgi:hypothetical protein